MTALDITLLGAFVLAGIVAFAMMGIDKWKARKGRYRTPEATLLLWCALGGGLGGWLGMRVFRHKTRHAKFQIAVPALMLLQLALLIIYFTYWR